MWWIQEIPIIKAVSNYGLKGFNVATLIAQTNQHISQNLKYPTNSKGVVLTSGFFDPDMYPTGTLFRSYEEMYCIFDPEMPKVLRSKMYHGERVLPGITYSEPDRLEGVNGNTGLIVKSPSRKGNRVILLDDTDPKCHEEVKAEHYLYDQVSIGEWQHFVAYCPKYWGLNKTRVDLFSRTERIEILKTTADFENSTTSRRLFTT